MAPLVPRMHLFEIDDQPWFSPWLRGRVQAALTEIWRIRVPVLQRASPAELAARVLSASLGPSPGDFVVVDFCAGAGGPTPFIEQELNRQLGTADKKKQKNKDRGAEGQPESEPEPVRFVLTDLHPHAENWSRAAAASPNVSFEPEPVDAAAVPPALIARHKAEGKKVLRLFNLAFHHFDDPLARAILKNTVETSDGFAIFELQDRSFASFLTTSILGVAILLIAPYYAWAWGSPMTLVFTYLLPVLPFVIVFDGYVSGLRTRTPEEVEVLLRTCGAEGAEGGAGGGWEVRSGADVHMWPCGYLNWLICLKKQP